MYFFIILNQYQFNNYFFELSEKCIENAKNKVLFETIFLETIFFKNMYVSEMEEVYDI